MMKSKLNAHQKCVFVNMHVSVCQVTFSCHVHPVRTKESEQQVQMVSGVHGTMLQIHTHARMHTTHRARFRH